MCEGPGHASLHKPRLAKLRPLGIGGFEKRGAAGFERCGIVEFMCIERAVKGSGAWDQAPVSQMQAALCETGFQPQEPSHGMPGAIGLDKPVAENHVTTTFSIYIRYF